MNAKYLGGTAHEHLLFMVAMCRFQHRSLPLASVHYVTWSVVGVALHVLAKTGLGAYGPIALALLLTAWALRLDAVAGLIFGGLQAVYAWVALTAVPGGTAALAVAAIPAALAVEVASHFLFQGHGPKPPRDAVDGLSKAQKVSFVPYFVVAFGVFFLTLDLMMRLLGHRAALNARTNECADQWQSRQIRHTET